jgi:hypothetical protein
MPFASTTRRGIVVLLLGVPLTGCYSWQGLPKNTGLREYVARKRPGRIVVRVRDSTPYEIRRPWVTADSLGGTARMPARRRVIALGQSDIERLETRATRLVVLLRDSSVVELENVWTTADSLGGTWTIEAHLGPVAVALADVTAVRVHRYSADATFPAVTLGLVAAGGLAALIALSNACYGFGGC